jgi:hypothetical protein
MRRIVTTGVLVVCMATMVAGAKGGKAVSGATVPPVTINGCLQRGDNGFRLTEASGAHAPKARDWKFAYLKKRAADVAVVDSSRKLKLNNHVGRRVALTGTMHEGELRAQSVRELAKPCAR